MGSLTYFTFFDPSYIIFYIIIQILLLDHFKSFQYTDDIFMDYSLVSKFFDCSAYSPVLKSCS
ncbi:hypothetical protein HCUR_00998 [Holospora curviuscula]|uniref:Uncharacterized protein n=1 Tax=Holospora curviuscula TaxID=1082868 RepID=A0A2S5R8B0_9PROT|nr:hypothetical protein HCUR_00998 [Holospora curviuscula]